MALLEKHSLWNRFVHSLYQNHYLYRPAEADHDDDPQKVEDQ